MISEDMENWLVTKDCSEHVENTIHDSSVAIESCLPNSVIDDVTGVVNDVSIGMSRCHSSECVFNASPWCVAASVITPETSSIGWIWSNSVVSSTANWLNATTRNRTFQIMLIVMQIGDVKNSQIIRSSWRVN